MKGTAETLQEFNFRFQRLDPESFRALSFFWETQDLEEETRK